MIYFKFLVLLITILWTETAFTQVMVSDLYVTNKKVVKKAQEHVRAYLNNIKDSLDLRRSDVSVRRFKLDLTDQLFDVVKDKEFFEVVVIDRKIPFYKYEHITKKNRGVRYVSYFKFDYLGNILTVKTNLHIVVR